MIIMNAQLAFELRAQVASWHHEATTAKCATFDDCSHKCSQQTRQISADIKSTAATRIGIRSEQSLARFNLSQTGHRLSEPAIGPEAKVKG